MVFFFMSIKIRTKLYKMLWFSRRGAGIKEALLKNISSQIFFFFSIPLLKKVYYDNLKTSIYRVIAVS